jgi:hypothetical protein
VGTGFRKTSCSNKSPERDGDSKKSHHALGKAAYPGRARVCLAGVIR